MRDVLIIIFLIFLLAIWFVTGLFQSIPSWDPVQAFSRENILFNLGLITFIIVIFVLIYLVRHFVIDHSKTRTTEEKAAEGLIIVLIGCLMMGLILTSGLSQKIPFLSETGFGQMFSKNGIFINALIVIGIALLAGLSYWIRTIFFNLYEDDEERK